MKRHKNFRKDELKAKFTDEQYKKRVEYLSCILNDESLPSEALDHPLTGDMLIIYTVKDDVLYLHILLHLSQKKIT